MSDDKQPPIEVDVEQLRRIEEDSEPAVAKERTSAREDAGAPGGTGGTGGTAHEQDD